MSNLIFDVAKWSHDDIKLRVKDLYNVSNVSNDFIELVIDHLERRFDASIGINWETIDYSIEDVYEDRKEF